MDYPHLYTLEEARRELPQVREIACTIRDRYEEVTTLQQEMLPDRDALEVAAKGFHAAVMDLQNRGCVLQDPVRGLLDFPARKGVRTVFLCWQIGEEDITHWHEIEDGFAGRQPIIREVFDGSLN